MESGGGVTEHTLTFSDVTVTVDGASVTSPYALTKDCTIVAAAPPSDKFTKYGLTCNGKQYIGGPSQISIMNEDITVSYYVSEEEASMDDSTVLTINYTA